jgi:hypothetical protein
VKRALVVPAVSIAALTAMPAPGLAKPRPCLRTNAELIEVTAKVIVYRSRRPGPYVWGACWRPTGRRTRIAPPRDFVIAGRLLAYVTITCIRGDETCSNTIHRVDLTGRQGFAPIEADAVGPVVLTASGAVGYVSFAYSRGDDGVITWTKGIRKVDGDGSTLLDQGEGIDPTSLALGGSTLYWTDAGQARSAVLR